MRSISFSHDSPKKSDAARGEQREQEAASRR